MLVDSNQSKYSKKSPRTFVLAQQIRYNYSSPVTDLRQQFRTIPPAKYGFQHRRRWHLKVKGVEKPDTCLSYDSFSNVIIQARVPRVDNTVEFEVEVEIELSDSQPTHQTSADLRYLSHTHLSKPDPAIIELAAEVRDGNVQSLCTKVHRALNYEWGITGVNTTASEALSGGRGVCQDYAHIMLAACRHAGLPARYVSGHLPGEGGSHAWVEVLHPVVGQHRSTWVIEGWDPTHNRKITTDYLVIAVGRDYRDAAPLSGTYQGDGVTGTLHVEKQLRLA